MKNSKKTLKHFITHIKHSTFLLLLFLLPLTPAIPYHYNKRNVKTGRLVSPGLTLGFVPGQGLESAREKYGEDMQGVVHIDKARMMGLDTGNPAADHEAGMWIAALIGLLTAAIPVAFLSPSLGFKKKRSVEEKSADQFEERIMQAMQRVVTQLGEKDL